MCKSIMHFPHRGAYANCAEMLTFFDIFRGNIDWDVMSIGSFS